MKLMDDLLTADFARLFVLQLYSHVSRTNVSLLDPSPNLGQNRDHAK